MKRELRAVIASLVAVVLALLFFALPAKNVAGTAVSNIGEQSGSGLVGANLMLGGLVKKASGPLRVGDFIIRINGNQPESLEVLRGQFNGRLRLLRDRGDVHREVVEYEVHNLRVSSDFAAYVTRRRINSPARLGDIWTQINGKAFTSSKEFVDLIHQPMLRATDALTVSYFRGGSAETLTAGGPLPVGYAEFEAACDGCCEPYNWNAYCTGGGHCRGADQQTIGCGIETPKSCHPVCECCTIYIA